MPNTFKLPTTVNTPMSLGFDFNSDQESNSWLFYIIFVLLLAFLGFNLFRYLAELTDTTTDILSVFGSFGKQALEQTVDVSAKGAKRVVNVTADTLDDTLSLLERDNSRSYNRVNNKPEPDYSDSNIQQNKAGYCFIGKDKGYRSCIKVTGKDKCMSGQIFPTKAVCVNPNLRE